MLGDWRNKAPEREKHLVEDLESARVQSQWTKTCLETKLGLWTDGLGSYGARNPVS